MSKLQIEKVDNELVAETLPDEVRKQKLGKTKRSDASMKKMLAFLIKMHYTLNAQDKGSCFVSDDDMSAACGMSKGNIRIYAQKLKEAGLLDFQVGRKRVNGGQAFATCYSIAHHLVPKINSLESISTENYTNPSVPLNDKGIESSKEDFQYCNTIQDNKTHVNNIEVITDEAMVSKLIELEDRISKLEQSNVELEIKNKELEDKLKQTCKWLRENIHSQPKEIDKTCKVEQPSPLPTKTPTQEEKAAVYSLVDESIKLFKDRTKPYQEKKERAWDLFDLAERGRFTDGQLKILKPYVDTYIKSKQDYSKQGFIVYDCGLQRACDQFYTEIAQYLQTSKEDFNLDKEKVRTKLKSYIKHETPNNDKYIEETIQKLQTVIDEHNRQLQTTIIQDEPDIEPF